MKYAIFHVIKGKPGKEIKKLKKQAEQEFDLQQIDFKTFPHITLKYDFETGDIKLIEKVLKNFCIEHKSITIKLSEVGTFNKKVIFMRIKKNHQLMKMYKDLYRRLKVVKWLTWEPYEGKNYKPHVTIVYKQLNKNNFYQVLDYLRRKSTKMKIDFNNLAITKVVNNERKIHKLYELR